jgi:hypothetical protein
VSHQTLHQHILHLNSFTTPGRGSTVHNAVYAMFIHSSLFILYIKYIDIGHVTSHYTIIEVAMINGNPNPKVLNMHT